MHQLKCLRCGAALQPENAFCESCGMPAGLRAASTLVQPMQAEKRHGKQSGKRALLLPGIMLAVVIGFAVLGRQNSPANSTGPVSPKPTSTGTPFSIENWTPPGVAATPTPNMSNPTNSVEYVQPQSSSPVQQPLNSPLMADPPFSQGQPITMDNPNLDQQSQIDSLRQQQNAMQQQQQDQINQMAQQTCENYETQVDDLWKQVHDLQNQQSDTRNSPDEEEQIQQQINSLQNQISTVQHEAQNASCEGVNLSPY